MKKKAKKESTIILIEYPQDIVDIIQAIGKEEIEAIGVSEQIKHEIKFEKPNKLDVIFQLINNFEVQLFLHPL